MTKHNRGACGTPIWPMTSRAKPLRRAWSRHRLPEDTRRAANGSQPRRLFLSPPAGNCPAGRFTQTISTCHEVGQPTLNLRSVGTSSLMFRVVPCAFRHVKAHDGTRVNNYISPRTRRHISAPLERRKEARDA